MHEILNFVFCVNDGYTHYLAVPIRSICENHRENKLVIHIFTDSISERNQSLLNNEIRHFKNAQLKFHFIDDKGLKGLSEKWSIYAWYRILAPILLPDVQRCLYLDADTLVCNNLSELFSMPMDDSPIACVIDVENFNEETRVRCGMSKGDTYVCSGIMLMNLEYWREHKLSDRIIKWAKENNDRIKFPDQDTLNILCKDNKIVLPIKYGLQNVFFRNDNFYSGELQKQLKDAYQTPAIIHYAGCAPWITEFSNNPLHNYWRKYNNMLSHKVSMRYKTQGINGLKVRLWRLLHPYNANADRLQIESKLRLK